MFAELKSIQGGISLTRKRRRRLDAVVFLAETMHKHSYGILEAIRTGLDNSVAEGLNNKVKTVVKRSYGFKTAKYRNMMIYLVAGKLELSPSLPT